MKLKPINLDELAKIKDQTSHSIFGPSSSSMWLNCPGSLIPNLLAPDTAGIDAAYGSVAHGVAEEWLKSGVKPKHLIGTRQFVEAGEWGHMIDIDEEMLGYVEMCVDWVEFLPGQHLIERRVDFSRITPIPNQKGTADFITVDGDEMWVVDWKFGKGHRVYAERNTQGMLYALGALWEFDPERKIKKINIWIGQPRLDHFDEWTVSVDDLLIFAGWAKARMQEAWRIDAPRVAGPKQCQFCRVQTPCAANAKMQVELTEGAFEALDHPVSTEEMREFRDRIDDNLMPLDIAFADVGQLTTQELVRLKPFRLGAEKWWKNVEIELLRRSSKHGEDLTKYGQKIVEGRSNRKFTNEAKAIEHLEFLGLSEDQIIEKKVTTPAKAEVALRKAGYRAKQIPSLLEGYTTKAPGKPTIVPLSDKRPPMADLSEDAFSALDSETSDEEEI